MTKHYAPTLKDVALKAKVSETTVSLSFNPNSRISEKTRSKILTIAKELNYVPNSAAKNLRAGRTKTIGFIVNDITESFYSIMSRTATNVAYNNGYQLIYAENGWSPSKAIELTKSLISQRVEGLILCLCEKEQESMELIKSIKIPHIVVDTAPSFYHGPRVINNEFSIGEIAGKHLVQQGCKKIAFFNSSKDMASFSSFTKQLEGFRKALSSAGKTLLAKDIIYAGFKINDGAEAFRKLIEKGVSYDGIFCINDEVAYGVIEEAEKHGIVIGKDLVLIGIDNLEYSELNRISLTSINIDYELMTTLAVTTLINGIEKNSPITSKIMLEPELIIRNSSKHLKNI